MSAWWIVAVLSLPSAPLLVVGVGRAWRRGRPFARAGSFACRIRVLVPGVGSRAWPRQAVWARWAKDVLVVEQRMRRELLPVRTHFADALRGPFLTAPACVRQRIR